MLPASRLAAVALTKNLAATCTRATTVAFIHHDRNDPTGGIRDKSEQMKMSTENMEHRQDAMSKKAKHVTENITDSNMGEKMQEMKDKLGDKVHSAKESVKETAQTVKDAFSQTAQDAKEAITGNKSMGEKYEELKDRAGEKMHEMKDYASEKAHETKNRAKETANQYSDGNVSDKMHEMKEKASEKYQQAKESVSEGTFGDKMHEMKEKIGDKYQQAKEVVGEKVQQAKEAVGDKVEELKMKIGKKEINANPNEFVPHMEVMENAYFDNIHDIDRIKARAEHLTDVQLKDLLRHEMSRHPKQHSGAVPPQWENKKKVDAEMLEDSQFNYDLTMDRGDPISESLQDKMQAGHSEQELQAALKRETEKRSKLSDPDPEQFVPRKEMEDNKYFDHIHDTDMMQMKSEGMLKQSLEDILRGELERRKLSLSDPDPDTFNAHMEVSENKYFDDIHNVDDMKIKAENLDREMEQLRRDLRSRDQTPGEEAEEDAHRTGKIDPFMTEKSGEERPRK